MIWKKFNNGCNDHCIIIERNSPSRCLITRTSTSYANCHKQCTVQCSIYSLCILHLPCMQAIQLRSRSPIAGLIDVYCEFQTRITHSKNGVSNSFNIVFHFIDFTYLLCLRWSDIGCSFTQKRRFFRWIESWILFDYGWCGGVSHSLAKNLWSNIISR